MPRYLVLQKSFLRVGDEALPRIAATGSTIEYHGAPGSALWPIDAAARAAVNNAKPPGGRRRILWDRNVRRAIDGLTRAQRAIVAAAETEGEAA